MQVSISWDIVISRIDAALKNSLTALDLSDLYLSELPESISQLTELQHLDLSRNQLIKLPRTIGQLRQLKNLNLSGSNLTLLPETICQMNHLEFLDLSGNKLIELPNSIDRLNKLGFLYLSSNQLTELPESIGQLRRLRVLNLANNKLTVLPESLRNLTSLENLYLEGNDALGLPAEVLGSIEGRFTRRTLPYQILEYYFRVKERKESLNEAKLILVGRGAVGKTSIVNRLLYNRFDHDEKKTEGISITEWKLRLKGNEEVRLNIWDFGGQEIMHATHQFFLTHRSLYLLVINGREGGEDADAEYWLKLIDSFGGESPVIVVLNKIRSHPFDLNRRALQKKYPAIRHFIKTDCEDGTGIQDLHIAIKKETDQLEHLRDSFPASWFRIKNQLAGMKKNYLSFEEYRTFCEQHGETEGKAQDDLAGYLHTLGIVLNFKDDPRLQDTHVLNPHWVTNGIYKILNSERLEKNNGEIRLQDLMEILDNRDYPAGMRRFILDLMKKFELCFSFPDDDCHHLVPELLDKQQPQEADDFKPEACLNFQYHYPVLPEGLLPRFIVRTHALSEGLSRWRTGVILQFEGCRALVKADVQDKKVFIYVSGPVENRRRLLAVIRSDFERIHHDIRKLQPQEMVPLPARPEAVVPYQELLVMEQNRMDTFPKVVGSEVLELKVHELLNGVDLEGTRRTEKIIEAKLDRKREVVQLFYSYSHKDESLRNDLETHLKLLQRQGLIESWHDRKIEAGEEWKRKIDENLERADIILLLVSADFIASEYCYEIEMKRALERHEQGEARVIPIILRDVNWKRAPFASLQALPKDGKAVTKWPKKDSAWRNVSEGIERVVEELRQAEFRLR